MTEERKKIYYLSLTNLQDSAEPVSEEGVFSSWLGAEWCIAWVCEAWLGTSHSTDDLHDVLAEFEVENHGSVRQYYARKFDAIFTIKEGDLDYPFAAF